MKAEYVRMITIAVVALVTMYLVAHYAGDDARLFGLTPVA